MNIAVILAGGSGNRFNSELPKQFVQICNRMIIEYSIEAFQCNDNISEIVVVCNPNYMDFMRTIISRNPNWTKVKKLLQGGVERYMSSLVAINEYEEDDVLFFHDAVRPLVSQRIINECVIASKEYDAIDVVIKTTDTIVESDNGDFITSIPNRVYLYNGQTPQCFKLGVIKSAYNIALKDANFTTTDDCGVVKKYLPSVKIKLVEGDVCNMKVTYPEDLTVLEQYLHEQNNRL